jgi:hypothetical protein
MKKDDLDRRCYISKEFCERKDYDDRIAHGSWYRKVTACRNYRPEDIKKWAEPSYCTDWGRKGGPCEKLQPWNGKKVVAKYREGAKEPYNIEPSFKLKLCRVARSHK